MIIVRIQIRPQRAVKQHGDLRDDRNLGTEEPGHNATNITCTVPVRNKVQWMNGELPSVRPRKKDRNKLQETNSKTNVKFKREISTPSILQTPESSSRILKSVKKSVLLPAPVRPTMPIFSPPLMVTLKLRNTGFKSARYRATASSYTIPPDVGQFCSCWLQLPHKHSMSTNSQPTNTDNL